MALAERDACDAWVQRVLGVGVPTASANDAPAPAPDLTAALAGWEDALEKTNTQIEALQMALRASPDKDLHDIAEFGLNAITANHRVKLQVALTELRNGAPSAGAALKLVTSLLGHIDTDVRVAACDANPFGVRMNLHATLAPALSQLAAALKATA